MTHTQKEIDRFDDFLRSLLNHGFRVFRSTGNYNFAYIVTENDQIGYVQLEMGDIIFSTVHKRGKNGTGYRLKCTGPRLSNAFEACETITPSWFGSDRVQKYDGWDQFARDPINSITEKRELTK